MTMAATLKDYLDRHVVDYQTVPHPHTRSSMDTAAAAHVPGDRLAKAVIVKDDDEPLMVVLPSDYHVHLGRLHHALGREVGLATEPELADLFPDCEPGAVPPVGAAYGLKTILDPRLTAQPEVLFESGDHETLVRVSGEAFRKLLGEVTEVDVGTHV